MAHIVYITKGLSSYLNTAYELARRLALAGHRVTFVSPKDVATRVEDQGFPFVRLEPFGPATDDAEHQRLSTLRYRQKLRHFRAWRRAERRVWQAGFEHAGVEQQIHRLNPDLLLLDIELHELIIRLGAGPVPVVLLTVWFSIWKRAGIPPLHEAIIPDGRLVNRLKVEHAWLLFRIQKKLRVLKEKVLRLGFDRIAYLKALARHKKFPFGKAVELNQWLIPVSYRTFPVFSLNARELEFPHIPPSHLYYVGPMIHTSRNEPQTGTPTGVILEALLARHRDDRGRTLIYCSLGSFWALDQSFLQEVIKAFADHPTWDLVLALGKKLEVDDLGPLPENVYAFDWVPQLKVLEQADAAITHGGISTINECIYYRVPMVVYSTKHVDQNGCAARVAHHGLGIMADKDRDKAPDIRRNVAAILTDSTYRTRIEAMREQFCRYSEANQAVHLIEEFIDRSKDKR